MRCNRCGGEEFIAGPMGRLSANGRPPRCVRCGSRERQRVVFSVLSRLPAEAMDFGSALQFSPDVGVPQGRFARYEVSLYGRDNSLDLRHIDRPAQSYDFVYASHVLEFINDDVRAFGELMRIVRPQGLVLLCFSSTLARASTVHYSPADEPMGNYRWYGRDVVHYFRRSFPYVTAITVQEADPATRVIVPIYFFTLDPDRGQGLARHLQAAGIGSSVSVEPDRAERSKLSGKLRVGS